MSHEQHLAIDLLARLAYRFGPASKVARELPGWLEYLTDTECPERPDNGTAKKWWHEIRDMSSTLVPAQGGGEAETVERNVALLGEHFCLSPLETRMLFFLVSHKLFDAFSHVVDGALDTREASMSLLLAQFCPADEADIRTVLRGDGRLLSSGLVERQEFKTFQRMTLEVSERLSRALMVDVDDVDALIALLFPPAIAPEAEWDDFAGLGEDAELIHQIISHALREGTAGINILLYGPTGTGKTEFAKVLARKLGAELRSIGETDVDGNEPSRRERLFDLALAGRMLGARRDTILLFDEMEDFVGPATPFFGSDRPSKIHANRQLEINPIPVIWTANSVEASDPAFRRRMTFSAHVRPPAGQVRARIWQRLEARHEAGLGDALPRLAEAHDHAPALVADAMRVTRLCNGGEEMIARVLDAAARLARDGVDPPPRAGAGLDWRPEQAATGVDLVRIEDRLAASETTPRVSFCVDGPAGSGKSAWARHLARRLGLPVVEKRASDLLSKWVGGSEKNIASAFAEARAAGAMLIFDEADSLLADRRNATRNWEISQVNEMLTWMEGHPLPFVCTTNLARNLDPATQRRFTFRLHFDWLGRRELPLAWAAFFEGEPPAGLATLERLTPGDFANVARRMHLLGDSDPAATLAELSQESAAKEGVTRPVGFVH